MKAACNYRDNQNCQGLFYGRFLFTVCFSHSITSCWPSTSSARASDLRRSLQLYLSVSQTKVKVSVMGWVVLKSPFMRGTALTVLSPCTFSSRGYRITSFSLLVLWLFFFGACKAKVTSCNPSSTLWNGQSINAVRVPGSVSTATSHDNNMCKEETIHISKQVFRENT